MKNPITYAVPFFLLSILVEVVALTVLDGHDDGEATPGPVRARGYERRDASTSLLMGVGSLVSTTVFKIGSFFVFTAIYAWAAPVHLPTDTWWYWVALVLALGASGGVDARAWLLAASPIRLRSKRRASRVSTPTSALFRAISRPA